MPDARPSGTDEVRTADVIGVLCLATDLAMGLPLEHGLHSTVVASRLAERLGVDRKTAVETYYGCLLFYSGCTADAELTARLFPNGALLDSFTPVMFGSSRETALGITRALGSPSAPRPLRVLHGATRLPAAARRHARHVTAMCEVAEMLSTRLGLEPSVQDLFPVFTERWDGRGPRGLRGAQLPLALRIVHVARDATFQALVGGVDHARAVIGSRAGHAFDPDIASELAVAAPSLLDGDAGNGLWQEAMRREPTPHFLLQGGDVDIALTAIAHFADLVSPFLTGHSDGVAGLAAHAARRWGMSEQEVVAVHRAGLVHDVGRVGVHPLAWQRDRGLSADEREQVRLHAYHTERVLSRSPFLAGLGTIAGTHHERPDGSGYHRGVGASALTPSQRLLAVADVFHAMTEPRAHRPPLDVGAAGEQCEQEARAGRLDGDAVRAVIEASGQQPGPVARAAGLTDREAEVVGLLARGLQTKQVARALGISTKTADRHIQNAYLKMGVSTRAAAAVFAMQHGLTAWGELPMGPRAARS